MQQPGEPSVEEILESIKKVIARESGAMGAPLPRSRPTRASAKTPDSDAIEPAAPEEAEEVLELDEEAMLALEEQRDDPRFAAEEALERSEGLHGPLTGEATASAMRENFAALAMLAQPGRPPQIVRSGETSLEGLTRELLRPMLAEWLDRHLPAMVEEMVKAEIARIAGKRS